MSKVYNDQDFIDYLKSLGVKEEKIDSICKKVYTRDLDKVKPRVVFYKKYLNADNMQIARIIELAPSVLSFEIDGAAPTTVKNKLAFYKAFFKINDASMAKLITRFPVILYLDTTSDSPTSFQSKVSLLQRLLKLSDQEVRKLLIKNISVLGRDIKDRTEDSIQNKIDFYKGLFNANDEEIKKICIHYNLILTTPIKTFLKTKIEPLKKVLKLNDEELADLIKTCPNAIGRTILGDSPTSVESKVKFFKKALQLDDSQVLELIKSKPVVLTLDTITDKDTSVKTKMQTFSECLSLNEIREEIIKNPKLLTVPARHFKIRYMLAYDIGIEDKFFSNNFLTSEDKIYARYRFLLDNNIDKMKKVNYGEKVFEKEFGISSDELIKRYPLDENAVYDIEQTFAETTGRNLKLNQAEREAVLGR